MGLKFLEIPVKLEFYSHGITDSANLMLLVTVSSCRILIIHPGRAEWAEEMPFESSLLKKTFSVKTECLWRIGDILVPELVVIFETGDAEQGRVLLEMKHEVFFSFECLLAYFAFYLKEIFNFRNGLIAAILGSDRLIAIILGDQLVLWNWIVLYFIKYWSVFLIFAHRASFIIIKIHESRSTLVAYLMLASVSGIKEVLFTADVAFFWRILCHFVWDC